MERERSRSPLRIPREERRGDVSGPVESSGDVSRHADKERDTRSKDLERSRAPLPEESPSEPSLPSKPYHVVVMVRLLGPWMLHRVMELVDVGIDAHIVVDVPLEHKTAIAMFTRERRHTAVPPIMAKSRAVPVPDVDGFTAEEKRFCEARVHYVSDAALEEGGFLDMQTKTCGKNKTAWERGMCWLAEQRDWDYVLTVEDDAQWTDPSAILQLCETYSSNNADLLCHTIAKNVAAHPRWPHWSSGDGFFDRKEFVASFNVVMRMSQRLLQAVKAFGKKHHTLLFHELFFASLAEQCKYKIHYWNDEPLLALRWRPEYSDEVLKEEYFGTTKSIFHPIKRETKIWYELPWAAERKVAFEKKIYSKPKAVTSTVTAYDDI